MAVDESRKLIAGSAGELIADANRRIGRKAKTGDAISDGRWTLEVGVAGTAGG